MISRYVKLKEEAEGLPNMKGKKMLISRIRSVISFCTAYQTTSHEKDLFEREIIRGIEEFRKENGMAKRGE